eukprot:2504204-Rhodomonas_salina.1
MPGTDLAYAATSSTSSCCRTAKTRCAMGLRSPYELSAPTRAYNPPHDPHHAPGTRSAIPYAMPGTLLRCLVLNSVYNGGPFQARIVRVTRVRRFFTHVRDVLRIHPGRSRNVLGLYRTCCSAHLGP